MKDFGTCACGKPAVCEVFNIATPDVKTPKCEACATRAGKATT